MATLDSPLLSEDEDIPQDDSELNEGEDNSDDPGEEGDPLEGKEHLQQALYKLYLKCCSEDRYPRMMEVKDASQACLYWRGLQYRWWSQNDESWNLPNQQQGLQVSPIDPDDMPRFEFVTNIYQAFGLSLIAAIAQAPPRTRFFPDDADVPEDVEKAAGFTKLAKIIERWNPIQVQLQDEVYHLWTGGAVGAWTRYIADGEKFGFEPVEDLVADEQSGSDEVRCAGCGFTADADDVGIPGTCPQCHAALTEDNVVPGEPTAVPSSAGKSHLANGRQAITIVGVLNMKRPIYARDMSDWHYMGYEDEIHYGKLRAAHPDKASKIKPGATIGEDNGFERTARLCVLQGTHLEMQTGEAQSVLTTYARVWFRPTAFYSDAMKKEDREELLDIFPRGCRVNFAGPEYCESESQSMDDCWATARAMPGDGQHGPALGSSMISVQDRFNTWSNIEAETYEYGIPITYRAADTWDANASDEQDAEPGAEVDVVVPQNVDIRTRIMQLRNDQPSPAMLQSMKDLMGPVAQFLTGAFPALLGAGAAQGAAGDTAAGYKMQMDQALGRCGISYVRLKQFHADIQTLACRDYCDNATGKAKMSVLGPSGDFETEAVDVTALTEGDACAYPEGDENFPELWNQQRSIFMQIMDTPQGQQLMQEPDNAELGTKLIGIPGLILPGADAKKKALKNIGILTDVPEAGEGALGQEPEISVSRDMTGQMANVVEQDVDDYAAISETVRRWMNSEEGQKCKKENPPGYNNVKAYMLAEKSLVPPPPPPEKPLSPSMTLAVDKMPPEAQAQILQKLLGVELSPEDFLAAVALHKAQNSKPTLPTQGQAGPPAKPGIPG